MPPSGRRIAALVAVLLPLALAEGADAAPIRTLLLGDSITFGVVSDAAGASYAELLGADLAGSHDIVNVAQSGTSAVYWAPSTPCPGICPNADTLFDELATPALPADIATVLLGTNDAIGFFLPEPTPVDAYEGFMREIVDGLFDGGVSGVVLMTAPRGGVAAGAEALLDEYGQRVATICQDTVFVTCGPDLHELLDPVLHFAPGDIHPNAAGHAAIADALSVSLRALPEPGTGNLIALGLCAAWCRRRAAPRPVRRG